jgi:hypothetical protein
MKIKNLTFLFLFVIAFSYVGFSQVDDEEGQMFGSKRDISLPGLNSFDFATIATDVVEHEFTLKNTETTDIIISDFIIPVGLGIIVTDNIIEPNTEAIFIVTVNKKYLTVGDFTKDVIVTTEQVKPSGVKVIKETTYTIKGKVE